ncbi:hypothetical protein ACFL56_00905 [Candidatus Margulisiibacteriota bacterium]
MQLIIFLLLFCSFLGFGIYSLILLVKKSSKKKPLIPFLISIFSFIFMFVYLALLPNPKTYYVKSQQTSIFKSIGGKEVRVIKKFSKIDVYDNTEHDGYFQTSGGKWIKKKDLFIEQDDEELQAYIKKFNKESSMKSIDEKQSWVLENVYVGTKWEVDEFVNKLGRYQELRPTNHDPNIFKVYYFPESDITIFVKSYKNTVATWKIGKNTQ